MGSISIAEAEGHLSELLDRVEAGESIEITRLGRPVARLTAAVPPRQRIDPEALRKITRGMKPDTEGAGAFVRAMRDSDRY
ncbi:MAG: type II toxin-antitoxin system prevent-host-death family antitoxin [Gluconacetobacter diazotrophicus]|nr:type II toxin-antitoxin system prevent-host-death family antitoxin [Gluconacetobacter diazotrophicus]